jgi:hypothetical protein
MNKYNLKKRKKNIEKFNLSERRSLFATSVIWYIITFLLLVLFVYLRPKNEERVNMYNNLFKDHVTYDSIKKGSTSFYFGDKDDTVIREYAYFNFAISIFIFANIMLFFVNLLKIAAPFQRNPNTGTIGYNI